MINYQENLKQLLSFYPHIYLSVHDQVCNDIKNYAINSVWYLNNGIIYNVFECYSDKIYINRIQIDISLQELEAHIDQLKRDEKLKEIIQIIND